MFYSRNWSKSAPAVDVGRCRHQLRGCAGPSRPADTRVPHTSKLSQATRKIFIFKIYSFCLLDAKIFFSPYVMGMGHILPCIIIYHYSPNMMLNQMFNDKLNAHVNIKWKLSQWITTREAVMLQKRSGPMWLRETLP